MAYLKVTLPSFTVIGIAGSTDDGEGFIKKIWDEANARYGEVASVAKCDENGVPSVWGLMSDMSMRFRPWENGFTKGRYLAGVEAQPDADAPAGWEKWVSPAYEYVVASREDPNAFVNTLNYIDEHGMTLVGAVYDRVVPGTAGFLFFPVKKI